MNIKNSPFVKVDVVYSIYSINLPMLLYTDLPDS